MDTLNAFPPIQIQILNYTIFRILRLLSLFRELNLFRDAIGMGGTQKKKYLFEHKYGAAWRISSHVWMWRPRNIKNLIIYE